MCKFAFGIVTKNTPFIMQGNFKFHNPTKLYFGEDSMGYLVEELKNYGPTVMFSYGGGSIKKNGIYDAVKPYLRESPPWCPAGARQPRRPHPRRGRRLHHRLCQRCLGLGLLRGRPLAEILGGPEEPRLQDRPRGCRAHHGGHRQRDERRQRHHQSQGRLQTRQGFRPGPLPPLRHPQPALHHDGSPVARAATGRSIRLATP